MLWDGSLVFAPLDFRHLGVMQQELARLGDHLLHVSVGFGERMRFVDRRGTRRPAIRRSLEEGCLPIPHVETREGDFAWHETVFAQSLGRRPEEAMGPPPDDMLVVEVMFRVRNGGAAAAGTSQAHLWLHLGDTSQAKFGYKAQMGGELGKELAHRFEPPLGLVDGRVGGGGEQGKAVRRFCARPARATHVACRRCEAMAGDPWRLGVTKGGCL